VNEVRLIHYYLPVMAAHYLLACVCLCVMNFCKQDTLKTNLWILPHLWRTLLAHYWQYPRNDKRASLEACCCHRNSVCLSVCHTGDLCL